VFSPPSAKRHPHHTKEGEEGGANSWLPLFAYDTSNADERVGNHNVGLGFWCIIEFLGLIHL
jgi:hypothetical protein